MVIIEFKTNTRSLFHINFLYFINISVSIREDRAIQFQKTYIVYFIIV